MRPGISATTAWHGSAGSRLRRSDALMRDSRQQAGGVGRSGLHGVGMSRSPGVAERGSLGRIRPVGCLSAWTLECQIRGRSCGPARSATFRPGRAQAARKSRRPLCRLMDDAKVGAAVRVLRIRKRLTQVALAEKAAVRPSDVSHLERGILAGQSIEKLRKIAGALGMWVEITPRWRGVDLDRLLNARHGALQNAVLRQIRLSQGWVALPEVSYSIYGERGAIDVLAWHEATRTVLIIELKTVLVEPAALVRKMHERARLAPRIAERTGMATPSCGAVGDPHRHAHEPAPRRGEPGRAAASWRGQRAVDACLAPGADRDGVGALVLVRARRCHRASSPDRPQARCHARGCLSRRLICRGADQGDRVIGRLICHGRIRSDRVIGRLMYPQADVPSDHQPPDLTIRRPWGREPACPGHPRTIRRLSVGMSRWDDVPERGSSGGDGPLSAICYRCVGMSDSRPAAGLPESGRGATSKRGPAEGGRAAEGGGTAECGAAAEGGTPP